MLCLPRPKLLERLPIDGQRTRAGFTSWRQAQPVWQAQGMNSEFEHARWEAWRKDQIEQHGNDPAGWIRVARNLIEAGALLAIAGEDSSRIMLRAVLRGGPSEDPRTIEEERIVRRGTQTYSVKLMLFGFAVECLLKAHYLKRGGKLYVDGKLRHPKRLAKSHNLAELAQVLECSELFDEKQLDVLDLLSARNEMGRYPVHAKYDQYGLQPGVRPNGFARFYGLWDEGKSAEVFGIIRTIYRSLGEEIPASARSLLAGLRVECASYNTPMPAEWADE